MNNDIVTEFIAILISMLDIKYYHRMYIVTIFSVAAGSTSLGLDAYDNGTKFHTLKMRKNVILDYSWVCSNLIHKV